MNKSAISSNTAQSANSSQNASPPKWRPFPELRPIEIIQIMEELHLPLSEVELTKPSPAIVQRIFEGLIALFMGMGKSDPNSYSNVLSLLEYPELHSEALALSSFHRSTSRLMEAVGIDDFSLRDIISPVGSRFRMILSGVINFAKFREEQIAIVEGLTMKSAKKKAESGRLQLQSRFLTLKYTISLSCKLRDAIAAEEPKVAVIEDHIKAISAELKELKTIQLQMTSQVDTLKEEKSALDDKLAIKECSAEIDLEKDQISSLEKSHRETLFRADSLNESISDVQRTLEAMNIALESLQKRSDAELSFAQLSDKESRLLAELKDAEIRDEQARRQLSLALERTEKLHSSQATRRTLFESSLGTLKAEYEALSRERQLIQEKIDANERQSRDIEQQINSLKKAHQSDLSNFLSSYKCLRQQIHIYATDLKRAIGATNCNTIHSEPYGSKSTTTVTMIKDPPLQSGRGDDEENTISLSVKPLKI
ncbi:spindle pole body associated protein [Mitosporidium daphniae]|uniref:Spindle pole body associated protein n=1 Tax=Mitosporidium daphniae TaxID=1485682 RepID=A0A098VUU2_9MICR|nr:spindle pole body associated protein [Mitosporidium daphniae]KGG52715.1 spindle pole body associated protein [Mitosporidium daphniae]|eukprot:XP_013239180.1 spindle pole body associated protein [Mitosporidium daphniae]